MQKWCRYHSTTLSFDKAEPERNLSIAIGKGHKKYREGAQLFPDGCHIRDMNIAWGECKKQSDHERAAAAAAREKAKADKLRDQRAAKRAKHHGR